MIKVGLYKISWKNWGRIELEYTPVRLTMNGYCILLAKPVDYLVVEEIKYIGGLWNQAEIMAYLPLTVEPVG